MRRTGCYLLANAGRLGRFAGDAFGFGRVGDAEGTAACRAIRCRLAGGCDGASLSDALYASESLSSSVLASRYEIRCARELRAAVRRIARAMKKASV